jgi:hypothetical protein
MPAHSDFPPTDASLEAAILQLLSVRGPGKTICPSEVARAAARSPNRSDWQPLMEPTRAAALRLAAAGRIVITQRGREIDGATAKGAIRLRLR